MDDSCGVGEGINYFKVWVYLCLIFWWGDVSWHACMRNLPHFWGLLGDNSFPGPRSPKTSVCVGTRSVYMCVYRGVCAHCLPVMPIFSCAYRKEYIHVLLFGRLEGAALACHAVKDEEKRRVLKKLPVRK